MAASCRISTASAVTSPTGFTRIFRCNFRWYPLSPHLALRRKNMAQVYFHYSNTQGVLTDRCGAAVRDLAEAREHAAVVVHSLSRDPTWKIGAAGSCTSAMISAKRSSTCRSPPRSANCIEGRHVGRAIAVAAASPVSERDHDAMAQTDENCQLSA